MVEPNRKPEGRKSTDVVHTSSTSGGTEQGALRRLGNGSYPKHHTRDPTAKGRDIKVKAGNTTHSAEPQLLRGLPLASESFVLVRKLELWCQSWALQQLGVQPGLKYGEYFPL